LKRWDNCGSAIQTSHLIRPAPDFSTIDNQSCPVFDPPRKALPREVGIFGLRGLVGARFAGTIAVNVTQVMDSSKRLETGK
jgi:hypothetical protein